MSTSQRIKRLLAEKGLSISQFEKEIGAGTGTIAKTIARDGVITARMVKKIKDKFPDVNEMWLFGMAEEMLIDKSQPDIFGNGGNVPKNEATELGVLSGGEIETNKAGNDFMDLGAGQYLMIVPLVEDYAQAGYTSGYSDSKFVEDLPKHSIVVSQRHRGKYRAFRVAGESMNDNSGRAIMDNDIATGRAIDQVHWNSRFHLHKFTDYIIVHKEGILIKTIIEHNVEDGIIVCESRNPDKDRYPNFTLELKDVFEIFNVVAVDRPWK